MVYRKDFPDIFVYDISTAYIGTADQYSATSPFRLMGRLGDFSVELYLKVRRAHFQDALSGCQIS